MRDAGLQRKCSRMCEVFLLARVCMPCKNVGGRAISHFMFFFSFSIAFLKFEMMVNR